MERGLVLGLTLNNTVNVQSNQNNELMKSFVELHKCFLVGLSL